jgi:hypothetical protein
MLRIEAEGQPLRSEQDALDLVGATFGTGEDTVVVPVERLHTDFFDLRTGVAGAFVQKLVNYRLRLVVLGDISEHLARSGALTDWVRESNRRGELWFVADEAELQRRLNAIEGSMTP